MTAKIPIPLPRRAFLGLATTTGVAGGLGCLGVLTSTALKGTWRDEPKAATFEPHVGSRFCVRGGKSEPLSVELVEAEAHALDANRPAHVRREPFTLIFRAPRGAEIEDQICQISHPRLGTMEVFLSRFGPPQRGTMLQAVFG